MLFPFGAEWKSFALVFIVKALSFRCGVKMFCLGIYFKALSFWCGVKKFCLGIYCQGSFLSERSENVLPWYLLSRLFPFGAEWECFALVFIVKALSFRCGVKKLCLGIYSCCTMGFANNGFSQWSNQNLVRQLFWMLDGWRSTWVVFSCPCYEKMISIQMLHERGRLALKHCCKVVWPSVLVGGVFTWSTGIFVLTCVWHDSRRDTLHTVVTHCRDSRDSVVTHCRDTAHCRGSPDSVVTHCRGTLPWQSWLNLDTLPWQSWLSRDTLPWHTAHSQGTLPWKSWHTVMTHCSPKA